MANRTQYVKDLLARGEMPGSESGIIESAGKEGGEDSMLARAPSPLCGLNLGCGTRLFKSGPEIEWYNQDAIAGDGIEIVADWRDMLSSPGSANSWDIIVAHQTWEHAGCGEQPIKGCHAILKPGGSLIVSVPDLRRLNKMWESGELSTQVYMTSIYGPYDGTEYSRHRWGFDHDSLIEALCANANWSDIKDFDYRDIPGANIARDDRWILCVEAVK